MSFSCRLSAHQWGELLESPHVSVSMFSIETSISLVIMAVPSRCATRFLFFNCFEPIFFLCNVAMNSTVTDVKKTLEKFLFFPFLFNV